MPKYRIGWKRVVYVVVEAADKEEAAEKGRQAQHDWGDKSAEIAEELVWCEELTDKLQPL